MSLEAFLVVCFAILVQADDEALGLERRDELGDKGQQLKDCFGIQQWVWMTKMRSRADIEGCIRRVTGTSNPAPYINCVGLRTGWYKGKTGTFRTAGDNILRCIIQSETWCPQRHGKREVEEEEEILDIETRGFLTVVQNEELEECLGNVANKFLTKITTRDGFKRCFNKVCPLLNDGVIDAVAGCVRLTSDMGPGPKCNWLDFWDKRKMMIMNNRGRLGFCVRQQRQKCRA